MTEKPEDSRVLVLQLGFVHGVIELKCKAEILSHSSSHEQILQCHYSCSVKPVCPPPLYIPQTGQALQFQT